MIKILADENIERRIVIFLKSHQFNVMSVLDYGKGFNDETVLELAFKENRLLMTSDKDFGMLIFFQRKRHCGVILLRFVTESVDQKILILENVIKEFNFKKFIDKFVVISEKTVRINNK